MTRARFRIGACGIAAALPLILAGPPTGNPARAALGDGTTPVASATFEVARNVTIVPVGVGGSSPLRLMLDTGMVIDGVYLFHREAREQIGEADFVDVRVPGAGDGEPSYAVMADSVTLHFGGSAFENRRAVISTSDFTQTFQSDGVIGVTLFENFVVELDYDNKRINLYDPASFAPPAGWERLDLTLRKKIPWFEAAVSVEGEEMQPIRVYIDLAADEPLLLLVREGGRFAMPDGRGDRYLGTGLSGDVRGAHGRVSAVRIGSAKLGDVAAAWAPAGTRSKQEGADGIIGNGMIRRFNVIFDYGRNALYLKPNGDFTEPFEDL